MGAMPRKPLSVRLDEDLIPEIDALVAELQPRPSRIAMINHLLWQAVRVRRNIAVAAERLYRMQYPDGNDWADLTVGRQMIYLDLARQMIEDMSRAP
jgi:hypothetical protein